jgi:hypothetical protein
MARMLASDVVDLWFPVVLIKDYIYSYIIGICCFFANHSVSRSKKQDELTWNQDNASEWGDMSTHGLFFKWASTIKIKLSALDYYKANIIITSLKCNLFSLWYSWKWLTWRLKNNHSLTQKFIGPILKKLLPFSFSLKSDISLAPALLICRGVGADTYQ